MSGPGKQVRNGKSFEYALVKEYFEYLNERGKNVTVSEDETYHTAKAYYDDFTPEEQSRFCAAAKATIETMIRIEPGLTSQKDAADLLTIRMARDSEGQSGDVRDVIFSRPSARWEMGFSAKNNNDAVKHSRLSKTLDFGMEWVGVPCSANYWEDIHPIFDFIDTFIAATPNATWGDLGSDKQEKVYLPLLRAFRKELLYINDSNKEIPSKLISYLIGNKSFYKVIKEDNSNLVVVKAFNICNNLCKAVNGVKSQYKVAKVNLPTRIVEFEFKKDSDNTLIMILDGGWEISFRIHNAGTSLEHSLKFDIQLLGNPPVLFSQYLFQD